MNRREAQKQETRRQLLETAVRLFSEGGFLATKTGTIAQACGVSHGSLFAHFPTRDDLVIAALERFATSMTERIHETAQGGSIGEVLSVHLNCLEEHEALYAWLVKESHFLPEAARASWIGLQSAVSHHLIQAFARGIEEGSVRPAPLPLLFNGWIGLLHHYLTNRDLFAPGDSVMRRCGEELLNHYLGLIAKGEAP